MPSRKLWTQSRGRARRRCAMLEYLRFVEGWKPKVDAEALWFGTLFHWGMEEWWDPANEGESKLTKAIERVKGLARTDVDQVRLMVILRAYHERWISEVPSWEVLGIEMTFVAPLRNPQTKAMSRTWELGGKLDVQAKYVHNQRNYVVEHKTTSDLDQDFWLKLMMDSQASQYYVGADHSGLDVYGILYDVVAKTRHKPKTVGSGRKQKKNESDADWAKRAPRLETLEEFHDRLLEHYREHLDELIQRKPIARTDEQLADFLNDTWEDSKACHEAHRVEAHPRNPDACNDYHRLCEFFGHCALGESLEEDPRFERQEWTHPELQEEAINDARRENENTRSH